MANSGSALRGAAAALLVFLARAAGAGVIAANFGAGADGLGSLGLGGTGLILQLLLRAALLAPGNTIRAEDIDLSRGMAGAQSTPAGRDGAQLSELIVGRIASWLEVPGDDEPRDLYHKLVVEIERPLIELALKHAGGNQVRAARMLGLNRNTLRKKITDHKIVLTRYPGE